MPAERIIAIATSAGGLRALERILWFLPGDLPAAILVVQHLAPDHPSKLAELLNRHGHLHVEQAQGGERPRNTEVYVAPPNHHLILDVGGELALSSADKVHFSRPAADVLFLSVAAVCGARAIGVVLTGGAMDGATGIKAIKAAGGVTVAQDVATSEHAGMPEAAVRTGDVDYVLPIGEMAAFLTRLVTGAD
jgi:two-component system chemotaxis response regulator CheB